MIPTKDWGPADEYIRKEWCTVVLQHRHKKGNRVLLKKRHVLISDVQISAHGAFWKSPMFSSVTVSNFLFLQACTTPKSTNFTINSSSYQPPQFKLSSIKQLTIFTSDFYLINSLPVVLIYLSYNRDNLKSSRGGGGVNMMAGGEWPFWKGSDVDRASGGGYVATNQGGISFRRSYYF